jgi:hypothetical protein
MNLTSNVQTKRIHSSMRRERAPKNEIISIIKSALILIASCAAHYATRTAHCVYPIALRLDTQLPQSELKDQSEATTSRKARQIRRKSKTHKVN